jgi:hypothetical protein
MREEVIAHTQTAFSSRHLPTCKRICSFFFKGSLRFPSTKVIWSLQLRFPLQFLYSCGPAARPSACVFVVLSLSSFPTSMCIPT